MPARRLLAALAAAVTLVILSATSAIAAGASVRDPAYDQYNWQLPTVARRAQVDLVKLAYWTDSGRFYIRWTVRDLRSSVALPYLDFWQRGPANGRPMYFARFDTHSTPRAQLRETNATGTSDPQVCAGTTRSAVNYTANRITMSVPTSCLTRGYELYAPYADSYSWASGAITHRDVTANGSSFTPRP